MTYPPPQPGPGGSGQQPGNASPGTPPQPGAAPQGASPQQTTQQGPTGPPQQEPAWYGNQHTGMDQPGQQPVPQPQFPQPGAPIPRPDVPQSQFPPTPGWTGNEPGHTPWDQVAEELAPDERKRRWPWIAGGLVVVLAAAGAGAAFLVPGLTGPADPGDPKPVAQDIVNKVNGKNFTAINDQLCTPKRAELSSQLNQLKAGTFQVKLTRVTTEGDTANAALTGTFALDGAVLPVDQSLGLTVEDGTWKVCSLGE